MDRHLLQVMNLQFLHHRLLLVKLPLHHHLHLVLVDLRLHHHLRCVEEPHCHQLPRRVEEPLLRLLGQDLQVLDLLHPLEGVVFYVQVWGRQFKKSLL